MISPTHDEIVDNIKEFISLYANIDKEAVIYGGSNEKVPNDLFCKFNLTGDASKNVVDLNDCNDKDNVNEVKKVHYMLSVSFYRKGSEDTATILSMALNSQVIQQQQDKRLFSIHEITPVTATPYIDNGQNVPRSNMTLYISINTTYSYKAPTIKNINVEMVSVGTGSDKAVKQQTKRRSKNDKQK